MKTDIEDHRLIPWKKAFKELEVGECFEVDTGKAIPDVCIKMDVVWDDDKNELNYYNLTNNTAGRISEDKIVRVLNVIIEVYYTYDDTPITIEAAKLNMERGE